MPLPRINRLVACFVGLLLWAEVPWTFADLALLAYGLIASAFLAVTSRSKVPRLILAGAAIACAVAFVRGLPETAPLESRVRGARFEGARLAEILEHLARQRAAGPDWRFLICDPQAAAEVVTVEIPEGCSLREALGMVSRAARCEYIWHWFKFCGNAPRPSCAKFRFRRVGAVVSAPWGWVTLVDRRGIVEKPGRRP